MDFWEFNNSLFTQINDLGKEYTFLNPFFIFIAEYLVIFLALSIIYFWFTKKGNHRIMILSSGFTFIFAEIFGKLAGKLHFNYQPFIELSNVNLLIEKAANNSFPSDHTILFFSFCVSFFLFKARGRFIWLIVALLVGISRIWVGVHYPFDVFIGATISIFTALLFFLISKKTSFMTKILDIYSKFLKKLIS